MLSIAQLLEHMQAQAEQVQISRDWVGLIDEGAQRFFHELDYEREARCAAQFKEQMAGLGGITVAPVYSELTSGEVLTTAWVQGERVSPHSVFASLRLHANNHFVGGSTSLGHLSF